MQVFLNLTDMVGAVLSGNREAARQYSIDSETSVGVPFGVSIALGTWIFVIMNWSRL